MNPADGISLPDIESVYSLCPAQEGMLFHDLYGEGSGEYISQLHWRVRHLHVPTFQRAWKSVVQRHGVLRTAFVWEQVNRPVQAVQRDVQLQWQEEDWTGIDTAEQGRRLEAYRRREFSRGFVLTRAPLMRMAIIRLGADEHEFIWTKHHALLDGWSGALVLEDVAKFYQAFMDGKYPELKAVRPYRDYISWLQQQDLAEAEKYWRGALSGLREPTVLQLSRAEKKRKYGEHQLLLDEAEMEHLRTMCRKTGVTLNTLVQGAWALLLSRYGGTRDVVFGAATSGRPADLSGAESMVGLFINTLPVRVQVGHGRLVREFLRELHRQQAEARQYEYASLVSLQEWSELGRGTPLFDSIIVFENYPVRESSRVLAPVIVDAGTSDRTNYGLTLLIRPTGGAMLLDLLYDEGQYSEANARQLAAHCRNVLLAMASSPDDSLDSLDVMSKLERVRVLVEWNRTSEISDNAEDLHDLLVGRRDDVIALEAGGRQLSYREVHARSDELASRLCEVGVGPEVRVGVCLDRSAGLVIALLAVLKAGGAYVPLDSTFPRQRLAYMLQDADVRVLLKQGQSLSCLPPCAVKVVDVDETCSGHSPLINRDSRPDHLAYIIYTSGSTGKPKGVQITRGNLANFLNTMRCRSILRASDRVLAVTTISFDIAALEIFLPLVLGARVVLADGRAAADPQQLRQLLAAGITAMQATPATWQLLVESGWKGEKNLKILSGGEGLPADLAAALLERGAVLWNLYGPTETTIWSSVAKIESGVPPSVGKPIGNTRIYLLDDSRNPVPVGVSGELWIAGAGVARGYVNSPELTADKFRPEPFGSEEGGRMYCTGDLARYSPDGNVELLGRKDSQIKLRGHRVELGEIETHLRSHQAVTEACVIPRQGGKDDLRLAAYIACDKSYFSSRNPRAGDEAQEVVQRWGSVWDQTYRVPNPTGDPAFNIVGWRRSDANSPIPETEMREWVDWTTRRILALSPRRVLDTGCGTGLLLFPLAANCETYCGTDVSDAALQCIRGHLPSTGNVTLLRRAADNFAGFVPGQFDTIVLNSVIQYFPGPEYLLEVLEQSVRLVQPHGSVFIGDVRSLPLLEALHGWCVASQGPPNLAVRECLNRVRRRVFEEKELALAPEFFHALQSRCKSISAVETKLKRGSENELTRFRYDVVLHVGDRSPQEARLEVLHWTKHQLDLSSLRRILASGRPAAMQVRGIPNRRVVQALDRVKLWRESRPEVSLAEAELRLQKLESGDGVAPEALIEIARELQYEAEIYCTAGGSGACFDTVFVNPRVPGSAPVRPVGEALPWHGGAMAEYVNSPARSWATPELRNELENLLRQHLPAYMLPASYVFLDRLPRTPNGKWNLNDLPDEDSEQVARPMSVERGVPRNPIEEILAGIWEKLLRVGNVFRHDNFFQLGGHSLLATRLVSRVRDKFGVDLSLRQFFDNPTVAQLAELIEIELRAGLNLKLPPMQKILRGGDLPLSLAQERFWFLHQFDPTDPAYNICVALAIDGALDVITLSSCFQDLLQRHEVLRTTYPISDGQAVARVADARDWVLHFIDLDIPDQASQMKEAEMWIRELAATPFDLATGPLFKAVLLRLHPQQSLLFFCVHHIAADEQSTRIMVRELAEFYGARMDNRLAVLEPLECQYVDFAAWQRSWLTDAMVKDQLEFWRAHLAGWGECLQLPQDHYPQTRSNLGGSVSFPLSEEATKRIRIVSAEEGATLVMTVVAALMTLLYRYTGVEDVVIGAAIANRSRRETENLIGLFVNTVLLRGQFHGNPAFSSLLKQVRETTLGVYTHQDLPFEMLVAGLYAAREVHTNPLFRVMFAYEERDDHLHLPGVNIAPLAASTERVKFDLTIFVREYKDEIAINLQYCRDLFDRPTVERLGRHLLSLLQSIAQDPGQTVDSIVLVDDSDRNWLDNWIGSGQEEAPACTLHGLFERQVRETPDAIALVCEDELLSYAELNLRADQLARYLKNRGVGPDARVCLCFEPSIAMIVGLLGVLKAGGAYVPLDPAFPQSRLEHMLSDSQALLVLTQRALRSQFSHLSNRTVALDDWGEIEQAAKQFAPSLVTPENLAYVIYTSGSTGRPKGVAIEHRQIVNYVQAVSRNLRGARRFVMLSTFAADLGNTSLYPALCTGGTLHLLTRQQAGEGGEVASYLTQRAIDCMKITPSHLTMLLATGGAMQLPPWLVLGGESSTWKQLETLKKLQPSGQVMNHYGPTENTVGALMSNIDLGSLRYGKNVPLGLPLMNVRAYVVDRTGGQVLPGAIGELYIGGAGVARGYLNRPELTAEKFLPDSFSGECGSRLYRTGDRVRYLANGNMEFLGRTDEQVKIRGYRVEPAEVESVLRSHPEVAEAAVKVGDEEDGGKRLLGYAVLRKREVVTSHDLRAWLRARLPEYMVPFAVIMLERMPLTPNGKLERRELPEPDWGNEKQLSGEPRDSLELRMLRLWEDLLGRHPIGVRDNFFDVGGHSLLAARLTVQIKREFGIAVPLASLFARPTVEGLASQLRVHANSLSRLLVRIRKGDSSVPWFWIHPVGGAVLCYRELAQHLGDGRAVYGLQAAGLEDGQPPLTTIPEMAARYVSEIRAHQPNGPYMIGGASMGGVVAFEVARQLESMEETVALLAILDGHPGGLGDPDGLAGMDEADMLLWILRATDPELAAELEEFEGDERIQRAIGLSRQTGIVSPEGDVAAARSLLRLHRANKLASEYYQAGEYSGSIVLLRAGDGLSSDIRPRTLGWDRFAKGGVEVQVVPGTHVSILEEPNVVAVGNYLQNAAEEALKSVLSARC